MRTTALLVIFLLALGLSLGPAPALAQEQAVVQSLPAACQPVSEAELSQLNGKFCCLGKINFCQLALCISDKLPISECTRERIARVCRTIQAVKSCFTHTNNTTNGSMTTE